MSNNNTPTNSLQSGFLARWAFFIVLSVYAAAAALWIFKIGNIAEPAFVSFTGCFLAIARATRVQERSAAENLSAFTMTTLLLLRYLQLALHT